jgi:hypothetical protein
MHMPKVSEMIVSKFLRKEDVEDELVVTIKDVKLENMPGDAGEQRWALYFRELSKGMVLNTTTIRVLEKSYGQDSEDWAGKKVTLYVDPNVSFKGAVVGGLRLRPLLTKRAGAAKSPAAAEPPAEEFDDKLPM